MTPPHQPPHRRAYHRRLHRWEPCDEVRLRVVPRYKTSGLSGDEWRHHVQAELCFKGEVVAERGWRDMETALAFLPGFVIESCVPIPERVIELEREKCDQPSCQHDAIAKYRLKQLTSKQGEYLAESESAYSDEYRQFCRVHLRRGDCSREDCDDNYEVLEGPGPEESANVQESPAHQVTVQVDSLEELPDAIERARKGGAR